ncbi:merlin-like [Paramacrobiotus metropolitanus]|uniref:merlin-like n=1 Tax=Paramacrobiotus metropolitanus TaxID=2943436 RepID=UPI0024460F6D|nr:merlin-like [Paramacrobiotus metropolitanus]
MARTFRTMDKNSLGVRVVTMDAELEFTVSKTATGKDLFELVCRAIGLRETWYFGLQYYDAQGFLTWLKPKKPLMKQKLPQNGHWTFHLMVRFYPEDVSEELIQDITQHLFFLQVRNDILTGHISCPPEEAILLASYDVQAKWGDADEVTMEQQNAFAMENLIAQHVFHSQLVSRELWQNRIRQWQSEHRGLSRTEAELEYLKVAQNLEMFGVTYFEISNKKDSKVDLGVTAFGLNIYEKHDRRKPRIMFPWSDIKNVSYEDTKFIIRPVKKGEHFSFYSHDLKLNKIMLDLCMGNHELYLRRRQPDSIEVQQMKLQAKEEKTRRYIERQKFLRERQLREELQREKLELQRQVLQMQEEIGMANEEMRRCQEECEVLAKKASVCEEEAALLNRKALDAEIQIEQLQKAVSRTEEEKVAMEGKVREAQLLTAKMVEEAERRVHEAESVRAELNKARMMEKIACNRLLEVSRSPVYFRPIEQHPEVPDYEHGRLGSTSNIEQLSHEIEREKMDYLEKSRHLQTQLNDLRNELETIKKEENLNAFLPVNINGMRKEKFDTLQKASSGTTKNRIQAFEKL